MVGKATNRPGKKREYYEDWNGKLHRSPEVALEKAEQLLEQKRIEAQEQRNKPVSDAPVEFKCLGHPNRTLALRYGIMNTSSGTENDTIKILKKGLVEGFEDRGHYLAELCDYDNQKVRVVIDEDADYINTFYPIDDEAWFEKYEDLEKLIKNVDAFSLKELAKYYIDVVVVPNLT